eukprot:403334401
MISTTTTTSNDPSIIQRENSQQIQVLKNKNDGLLFRSYPDLPSFKLGNSQFKHMDKILENFQAFKYIDFRKLAQQKFEENRNNHSTDITRIENKQVQQIFPGQNNKNYKTQQPLGTIIDDSAEFKDEKEECKVELDNDSVDLQNINIPTTQTIAQYNQEMLKNDYNNRQIVSQNNQSLPTVSAQNIVHQKIYQVYQDDSFLNNDTPAQISALDITKENINKSQNDSNILDQSLQFQTQAKKPVKNQNQAITILGSLTLNSKSTKTTDSIEDEDEDEEDSSNIFEEEMQPSLYKNLCAATCSSSEARQKVYEFMCKQSKSLFFAESSKKVDNCLWFNYDDGKYIVCTDKQEIISELKAIEANQGLEKFKLITTVDNFQQSKLKLQMKN